MSTKTPIGLFNAVFYYNGLNPILHGEDEHWALISQFHIHTVQDADGPFSLTECLIYAEHRSKNRPGGSKQLDLAKRLWNTFRMHSCTSQEVSWCFKVFLTKTASIVNERDFKATTYYQKFRGMTTNQTGTMFWRGSWEKCSNLLFCKL